MDVFDPNILQRVFLEAILQVGIKKSTGDLGPECPFNPNASLYSFSNPSCCDVLVDDSERIGLDADNDGNPHGDGVSRNVCMATMNV